MPTPEKTLPSSHGSRGHVPALDGVRAVALLLVLVHHLTLTKLFATPGWFNALVHCGWVGVDLFFVLSGFLITGILIDSRGGEHALRNFYARRTLRIFPLYFGVLAAVLLVLPAIADRAGGTGQVLTRALGSVEQVADRQVWLWLYLQNAVEGPWQMFNHFWSLAVEEHFYLVWPLVVLLLPAALLPRVCVGLVVLAVPCRILWSLQPELPGSYYIFTLCRMDALAMGGLLAWAIRRPGGVDRCARAAMRVGLPLAAVLIAWTLWRGELERGRWEFRAVGFTTLALLGAAFIAAAVASAEREGGLARMLGCRLFGWIGLLSYGGYVFHRLLMRPMITLLPPRVLEAKLGSPILGAFVWLVATSLVTLVVAFLSWHLYEKHFLKLKKHFVTAPVLRPPASKFQAP